MARHESKSGRQTDGQPGNPRRSENSHLGPAKRLDRVRHDCVRIRFADTEFIPQSEQLTVIFFDHDARKLSTSVWMPVGARCWVFGQVKKSAEMVRSNRGGGLSMAVSYKIVGDLPARALVGP